MQLFEALRNRLPNVTVRADIYGNEQPTTLEKRILPTLEDMRSHSAVPACAVWAVDQGEEG